MRTAYHIGKYLRFIIDLQNIIVIERSKNIKKFKVLLIKECTPHIIMCNQRRFAVIQGVIVNKTVVGSIPSDKAECSVEFYKKNSSNLIRSQSNKNIISLLFKTLSWNMQCLYNMYMSILFKIRTQFYRYLLENSNDMDNLY